MAERHDPEPDGPTRAHTKPVDADADLHRGQPDGHRRDDVAMLGAVAAVPSQAVRP